MLLPIPTTFLTGTVILAFYTSVASASPAAVSPNHTGLLRREVPRDSLCGVMEWLYRECLPNVSKQAYRDMCFSHDLNIRLPARTNCPDNTECFDKEDEDKEKIIVCVPIVKKGEHDTITAAGGQAGSSGTKEGIITPSMSMSHQMTVQEDIYGSLSAVLLSEQDEFVLKPASPIIGKIHGKGYTVCQGDPSDVIRSLECYPTGRFDFDEGDLVDFSWSMNNAQKGSLKYNLAPSGAKK